MLSHIPIYLPFVPASATHRLARPVAVLQSDFTAYSQRILSGFHYWEGEFTLPPLVSAANGKMWDAFVGALEAGDGTFWAVLHHGNDVPNTSWAAGMTGYDRHIHAAHSLSAGELVQVRAADNPYISEVAAVRKVGAGTMLLDRELMLTREDGLDVEWRTGLVSVRARLLDDDYSKISAANRREYGLNTLRWVEAIGQIADALYQLRPC